MAGTLKVANNKCFCFVSFSTQHFKEKNWTRGRRGSRMLSQTGSGCSQCFRRLEANSWRERTRREANEEVECSHWLESDAAWKQGECSQKLRQKQSALLPNGGQCFEEPDGKQKRKYSTVTDWRRMQPELSPTGGHSFEGNNPTRCRSGSRALALSPTANYIIQRLITLNNIKILPVKCFTFPPGKFWMGMDFLPG